MATKPQSARELLEAGKIEQGPEQLSDDEMAKFCQDGGAITLLHVDAHENEEFGLVWELRFDWGQKREGLYSLWAHERRDTLLSGLMQALQDGPITGLRFRNEGSGKKPFILVDIA